MGPDHEHGIGGSGYIQHGIASHKFNFICNFIFIMLNSLRQAVLKRQTKKPEFTVQLLPVWFFP
jgi:hypothetical protein